MAERCIVKSLGKSCTSFAGVHYNEMKVAQGMAKCVLMRNFGDLQKYNIHAPVVVSNYLQKIADHNSRVSHKQKHMTFSFPGKATPEQTEQLLKDAAETMDRLGYKDQPQIYWVHNDTDNTHIHVVSVTVSVKNGMWIDNYMEGRRARRILDQLRGHNYKSEIDKLFDYKFESREQFKSLLLANGYRCYHDEENGTYDIIRNHELVGSILTDELDKKIAANGRNKDNYKNIVVDLRGKLMDNRRRSMKQKLGEPVKVDTKKGKRHTLTNKLAEVKNNRFNGDKGLDIKGEEKAQFKKFLIELKQKLGISLVFSQWKDGQTKGYTLIDNKNKIVFKGSDVVDLQKLLNPDWKKGQAKDALISANDASSIADEISMDKNLPQFLQQQFDKLGIEVDYNKEEAMNRYGGKSELENRDMAVNLFNQVLDMVANQEDLTEEGEEDVRNLAKEALDRAVCADSLHLQEEERLAQEKAAEESRLSEQERARLRLEEAKGITPNEIGEFVVDFLDDFNIRHSPYENFKPVSSGEPVPTSRQIGDILSCLQKSIEADDLLEKTKWANSALYLAKDLDNALREAAKAKTKTEKPVEQKPAAPQEPKTEQRQTAKVVPFVKIEPSVFIGDDRRIYIEVNINGKAYKPKAMSAEHSAWYQRQVNHEQAAQDLALHYYANEIQKAQVEGWKEQHYEAGRMPFGITVGEIYAHPDNAGRRFWVNGDFYDPNGKKIQTSSKEVSREDYIKYVNSDKQGALPVVCKSVGRDLVKDWGVKPISSIKNALFESPAAEGTVEGMRESVQTFEAFTSQLCNDFLESCGEAAAAYFNLLLGGGGGVSTGGAGGGGGQTGGWGRKKDDDDLWKRGGGIMGFQPPKKKSGGGPKR